MPYKNNGITTRPYTPVHDETQTHLGKNWAQIGRKSLVTSVGSSSFCLAATFGYDTATHFSVSADFRRHVG